MDRRFVIDLVKDWGLALVIAWVLMALWRFFSPPAPDPGGEAPPLVMNTIEGEHVDLAALPEKWVIVNFWATWCGPCRKEIPDLAAFHTAHPEVALLGVSVDVNLDAEALREKSEAMGINYPVLKDSSGVADAWRVQVYPTTFVIDADRHIRTVHVGPLTRTELETLIKE
jgi:cytochrome c biogenesis protein CcmG/thiol:disulfide interchange protein DsbE